jgi:hypothetical protein
MFRCAPGARKRTEAELGLGPLLERLTCGMFFAVPLLLDH